jgi:hypothetical protein
VSNLQFTATVTEALHFWSSNHIDLILNMQIIFLDLKWEEEDERERDHKKIYSFEDPVREILRHRIEISFWHVVV